MAAYYPNNVTTDHIQQYLDENKSLILKIVDSQNSGKLSECAENQARLQRNLMYLAAIADSQPQPQPPNMNTIPYPLGGGMMYQPGTSQYQQAQQMTQQSLMSTRSSGMFYSQQPYPALQQQLGMCTSAGTSSLHILQGEVHNGGGGSSGGLLGIGFSDYGRDTSSSEGRGSKHDIGSFLSAEARGGSSSRDGGETMYLKSMNQDGNS